ncbi:saccharopine dehydrogenase-like oxidoreductase [Labeo rohita]|uniref:Saccharopine dehydrogenase-like oxidoreductase n=1 Tax=Labeo rohita TaxID=84645 RepID=A0A498N3L1_LABRO|nr:saccharopine dehydrogenase-like oxidoreductase [Labeo rohita]
MAAFSTSSSRPYHIIIFGASGFTGQFVVEEVARTASEGPKGNLKWAVAGRNRTKLEKVVEQAAGALSKPELKSEVDILIADVSDPDSLAAMCKQAVIVLSCVGPYRFFGEPVVKSCVESGTHCIDISGEPQFLESMQLNYNDQAAEKGVYIVGSCGFDSIPADMGVIYTRDQFKAVESFLTASSGPEVQYGAYAGVGGISNVFKLIFAGLMFFFLVKFNFGRNLLKKFPEFFSFGFFSKAGPTRKQMEGSSFSFIFLGEGYTEGTDPSEGKPNGKIRTLVKGPEAGYVATPIAMVQAALTMLNEPDSLPKTGGVYTPGATFAKTTLINRLNKHGIQFSVL